MEQSFSYGGRNFKINNLKISVDSFEMSPAEVDIITQLLGIAGQMAELNGLPESIANEPFSIVFGEDGEHRLDRSNRVSIPFTFEGIDELIEGLHMALAKAVDMQKMSPQTIPIYRAPNSGDVFEGRD